MESKFVHDDGEIQMIATDVIASGEVRQLLDGRAAVREGLQAAAIGDMATWITEGIFKFASASATTFAKGTPVVWDASANLAVPFTAAINASEDFYLGIAVAAKVATELDVTVDLNAVPYQTGVLQSMVFEFVCATDTTVHTLIPAAWNKRGLVILGAYGLVTEAFAGGSQDQGIVTIKDTATSPNTICTLTPTDGGADSLNDVVAGTNPVLGAATGAAVISVAAGLGVTGTVTQVVAGGSAAGKLRVFVLAATLV